MTAPATTLVDVFGKYASGVTVVTCLNADGQPHGATVTAFTAVSHTPYLCQVTLAKRSKACAFLDGRPFAVNFLGSDQADVAMHFAGRPIHPIPELTEGATAPMLANALATVSCVPWRTYDAGDHLIFLGEIVAARVGDKNPLVYFSSAFHALAPVTAANAWNGCSDDPLAGWFDQTTTFVPAHLRAAS